MPDNPNCSRSTWMIRGWRVTLSSLSDLILTWSDSTISLARTEGQMKTWYTVLLVIITLLLGSAGNFAVLLVRKIPASLGITFCWLIIVRWIWLPINFYQSYFPQVLITTRTLKTINNEFILHFSLANFIGVFFTWQFGKLYGICVAFVWSLRWDPLDYPSLL